MNALTTIITLSPTRMGMGQAVGLIDLPVHREVSTNWPVLSGSGVKGVLKDWSKRIIDDGTKSSAELDAALQAIYGTSEGAGELAITDLFCLLFPVQSSYGVFAWVTCPLALDRLRDLAGIVGSDLPEVPQAMPTFPDDGEPTGIVHNNSAVAYNGKLSLDELDLSAAPTGIAPLAEWIASRTRISFEQLRDRLVIVHDDIFTFLTEQGTELRTKTALEYSVKKVKDGSLRQEEYIPSYAVFAGVANFPSDDRVLPEGPLQVGAEASTGAGLVYWKVVR
jgi:CRISPR-associated protein Cmr4